MSIFKGAVQSIVDDEDEAICSGWYSVQVTTIPERVKFGKEERRYISRFDEPDRVWGFAP